MSENVFNKIKGLFSNKHHKEKRIQKQNKEHDVLRHAIEQPLVKEPLEVMVNPQNIPEKKEPQNVQVINKNEVLEQEPKEIVSKKKDYKSVYKKHVQNLSDKDDFSESIYSNYDYETDEEETKDEKENNFSKDLNKNETFSEEVKETQPKNQSFFRKDTKTEEPLEEEPVEEKPVEIKPQEELPKDYKEDNFYKKHELSDKEEPLENNYEFLKKKESSTDKSLEKTVETPKLKKFFESKDPPITTGLNRFKNTSEGYEFLTKKDLSKPKNKPNYNKVNY